MGLINDDVLKSIVRYVRVEIHGRRGMSQYDIAAPEGVGLFVVVSRVRNILGYCLSTLTKKDDSRGQLQQQVYRKPCTRMQLSDKERQ